DDPDGQEDRDDERAAPAALQELAPGHEPDRTSTAHDRTTSMNSSERVGGWNEKRRTSPALDAAASSSARSTSAGTRRRAKSPRASTGTRPGRPASQAFPLPATST